MYQTEATGKGGEGLDHSDLQKKWGNGAKLWCSSLEEKQTNQVTTLEASRNRREQNRVGKTTG